MDWWVWLLVAFVAVVATVTVVLSVLWREDGMFSRRRRGMSEETAKAHQEQFDAMQRQLGELPGTKSSGRLTLNMHDGSVRVSSFDHDGDSSKK